MGRRAVGQGGREAGLRQYVARSQSRKCCASPTPLPARCATSSKRRSRPSSKAATAASTGATCRSPRSSSGSASATIGATSTSTIPRPASSRIRSPRASGTSPNCCAWTRRIAALLPRRGPREGARPLLRPLLPHRLRRQRNLTLLTPEDGNHEVSLSHPPASISWIATPSPTFRPSPWSATIPASWWRRSSARTSPNSPPPDGSRPTPFTVKGARRRPPISTA